MPDVFQTLQRLFEAQVEQFPHRIAVRSNADVLTYAQLNQRVNQLAHQLMQQGVTSESMVAIYLERSTDFLIAVLAVLKAGSAYIPLDTSHPNERVALILKDAGSPFILTSTAYEKRFAASLRSSLILINDERIVKQSIDNPTVLCTSNHLAYVIYTSGSTGTPKGVLIEHGSVINYALWFSDLYPDVQNIDFSSNPAFDMAVTLYLVPLVLGLTVRICTDNIKKDPKRYLYYLHDNAVDFIKLTPSYFKILGNEVQRRSIALPQLKILLGGENLSKSECALWLEKYPHHRLYNEYGPTETTVAVTAFAIDQYNINSLGENIPIGTLGPNIYAYILDSNLNPVALQDAGELYLGGLCLARGYLNHAALTEQQFIQDPFSTDPKKRLYKTGDFCRLTHGVYECLGRIDYQIKIRGFRVELAEVEYYLEKHPGIKTAVVIASTQYRKENSLIAYFILKNNKIGLDSRELSEFLKHYLPDYMIPVVYIKMDALPLTANDKLDRSALPIPQFTATQHHIPARSTLEKKLVTIWSDEIGVNPIGVTDDFFELGGHSLSAARIVSAINHTLEKEISLQDFYAHTTISLLSQVIEKAKPVAKLQFPVDKIDNDSRLFPLNDFQFMLWIANVFEPKAKKLNIFVRKRLQGCLDINRLNRAFAKLLEKHEVLSCHPSRFIPGQYVIKNPPFKISEVSLQALEEAAQEEALRKYVAHSLYNSSWPKDAAQIRAQLFHLNAQTSELLLCLPHIISDDISVNILLSDLSDLYDSDSSSIQDKDRAFRSYLLEENHHLAQVIHRDTAFWENYLKDAYLYPIPAKYVIRNMRAHNASYSTYIPIPREHYASLMTFCSGNHISISDGLSAAVVLALKNCTQLNEKISLCINRVKSTRESRAYENASGCFLRIEPIKLMVAEQTDLLTLSQDIHQEAVDTNIYQGSPSLIKLASISTFRKAKKRVSSAIVSSFFWLYSMLFPTRFYYHSLRVITRLNSPRGNNFLIIINVNSNFLAPTQDRQLFGLNVKKIPHHSLDLLNINNIFEVDFFRKSETDDLYLVISANLQPEFRERIGQEVIHIMRTSDYSQSAYNPKSVKHVFNEEVQTHQGL